MKQHGMRKVPGMQIHHIDLDPSNNNVSNLFQTKDHGLLHDQLRYLLSQWRFVNLKYISPGKLVRFLLKTGELVFERDIPRYRMNPIDGQVLGEYEKILNSLEIFPPYTKPDLDVSLAIRQLKMIPLARLEIEVLVLEAPVRNATLRTTTTKSTLPEEREEREE